VQNVQKLILTFEHFSEAESLDIQGLYCKCSIMTLKTPLFQRTAKNKKWVVFLFFPNPADGSRFLARFCTFTRKALQDKAFQCAKLKTRF
jgi:hypothetical protein